MRLADWIEALEKVPATADVMFDDGTSVGRLTSWRGVYAQLSIDTHRGEPFTAIELLKDARDADGGTFTGWKGGDYTMDLSTPVWADEEGTCPGRIPLAVDEIDGRVVVRTGYAPSEYREFW